MAFPSEDAALKVMYLALRNVIRKWEKSIHWKAALNCFHGLVGGPHPGGNRKVASFPLPRIIFDTAGCARRQGSPLRCDERAEERAPLTAAASGQIIQLSGA